MGNWKKVFTGGAGEVPRGESVYSAPGTFSWTCPDGVTSVSVVCVGGGSGGSNFSGGGGGALAYKNNFTVTPGNSYTVAVGKGGKGGLPGYNPPDLSGGQSYFNSTSTVKAAGGYSNAYGGNYTGDGGGNGGNGNFSNTGGGGGYSGQGGGSNGAASGGSGQKGGYGGGGGGVGLLGTGSTGSGDGSGGSGGESADQSYGGSNGGTRSGMGGTHGGGGGGATSQGYGYGADGAVRIIWPGDTRQFPSTDCGTP